MTHEYYWDDLFNLLPNNLESRKINSSCGKAQFDFLTFVG